MRHPTAAYMSTCADVAADRRLFTGDMDTDAASSAADPRTDAELRADWAHANKPTPPGPRDPDARADGVASLALLTTLVVLLLAPVAFVFAGLSVMATDSCGPDDCSAALDRALDAIFVLLPVGGLVSLAALVCCWALPWKVRFAVWRGWAAVLAVVPHVVVIVMVLTLPEG